jgi:hypothetical protein
MKHIEALLICDGSSDAALEHPVRWLLSRAGYRGTLSIQIADFSRTSLPSNRLKDKITDACSRYKPDVLFVHRDAERLSYADRLEEISLALQRSGRVNEHSIPIVPVRMLEAWLLFDEAAIRRAAGNPNGNNPISLPRINRIESEPDPKQLLCDLLSQASGLAGRRLKRFRPLSKRHLVAEEISDFSPLETLESFAQLRDALRFYLNRP